MHKIRRIKDSQNEFHYALNDLISYAGISRGRASRISETLPEKYVQSSLIKDSSGSEQKTLVVHQLAAIIALIQVTKGEVTELFKELCGGTPDEENWEFIDVPTTTKVREGRSVSTVHHKIVEPVLTLEQERRNARGSEPREITINGKKHVEVFNPSTGVTRGYSGSLEDYMNRDKDDHSHMKYPPEQKPLTFINDKGQLVERNTMRIIEHAKVDGSAPIEDGNVTVTQEEYVG